MSERQKAIEGLNEALEAIKGVRDVIRVELKHEDRKPEEKSIRKKSHDIACRNFDALWCDIEALVREEVEACLAVVKKYQYPADPCHIFETIRARLSR